MTLRGPLPSFLVVVVAACTPVPATAPVEPRAPVVGPTAGATIAASIPSPSTAPQEGAATDTTRRAVLRYELNGHKFPLPLVHGSIEGEPVWMLVDTGANSHVMASWIARKVGLSMHALGGIGSDHTGRAVNAYTVRRPRIVIDEWGPLGADAMLVTDVPEPIARIGIGAFVSPQWLAAQGDAVVLDLSAGEMHIARWLDASRELDARGGRDLAPTGARLCEDSASTIKGLAFVLAASVDGHPVELLLDTGAHRTDLLTTSKAGRALATRAKPNREQVYAASGLVHTTAVPGAQVRIGNWAMTSELDLVSGVADPSCPRDGVVAMDALDSCTLLLGRKRFRGRCGL